MKKRQVMVIHGGDAFPTYEQYLEFLREFQIDYDPNAEKKVGWKKNLADDLGETYEVIAPQMPNKFNAKYEEWKIWFEKYIPFLRDEVILVGHSLGGAFLVKYLSENIFPKKINSLYSIAAPFDTSCEGMTDEFAPPPSLHALEEQVQKSVFMHSEDDLIVPIEDFHKYKASIPSADFVVFSDRGHFLDEHFPELVADIKNVA